MSCLCGTVINANNSRVHSVHRAEKEERGRKRESVRESATQAGTERSRQAQAESVWQAVWAVTGSIACSDGGIFLFIVVHCV
ncbi:hypothetical protein NEQG_02718 [Nematocida parisii ERTm3]|uniref:Uncharacterized protein n=1 Tax=Nematocida parisii (strain ERTm3) TaxID=935791 RepID=I3ECZ3_NEMP3|nr:hypothetical protein NEQG_02718 [Nematocida parisii ERTm3]